MRQKLEKRLREWFVPPSSGLHLDPADGLRGLAILLVVCGHGTYFNPQNPNRLIVWLGSLVGTGWMGVQVFFVLSGFLVSLTFFRLRQKDLQLWYPSGYATRRALKIFPPFYFVIVAFMLFYFWRYHDAEYFKVGFAWASGIAHFVYFPTFFNGSFWSLWVEVGFYLVLPLLFFALRGVGVKALGWILFGALVLVPLVSRAITLPAGVHTWEAFLISARFPNFLDNFAWGVLFSSWFVSMSAEPERYRRLGRLGYVGLVLLFLSCVFFAASPRLAASPQLAHRLDIEMRHLLPTVSAFLLLFLVFDPTCWLTRFFSSPALRFVGIVSYEWFLIHQPLQMQFRSWLGDSLGHVPRLLLNFSVPTLVSFGLAVLLYHSFSYPILRWGRERVRAKRPSLPDRPKLVPG